MNLSVGVIVDKFMEMKPTSNNVWDSQRLSPKSTGELVNSKIAIYDGKNWGLITLKNLVGFSVATLQSGYFC